AASALQPYGIDLASYRQAAAGLLLGARPPRVPASYRQAAAGLPPGTRPPRAPASQSLAEMIAAVDALLERTDDLDILSPAAGEQRLRRKPWSRKEALGHLVDWATAHHQWFARALTEPKLAAAGYPDDNWVALERYADLPWQQIVDLWAALNRLLVHVLRQIPEEKLNLPCRIGIAEPIPLERLVANYLDHLEDVLGQILMRGQAG
ncbi:MAG: DinB family protein, partial [Bryobacteraceae bacterium]